MTKLLPALPMLVMATSAVVFVWRGMNESADRKPKRPTGIVPKREPRD